jgi:hypothetical protein
VSAAPSLRFTIAEQPELLIHKRKVKKSTDLIAAVSQ